MTVINVYTKHIKQENCDFDWSLISGLGDFLRGTISLLKLSKEIGFNLLVDLRYNPISKFLKNQDIDKLYLEKVDENLHNLKFFFYVDKLREYIIESFKHSDIITLHTNAIITNIYRINTKKESLSDDEQNFLKNIFTPNDELKKYIDEKMINIPLNYEIIHFRFRDEYSFESNNNIPENILIQSEELFKNNYNENTILLSSNKYFKNYIKSKYNIHIIDNDIVHLGDLNNNLNNELNGIKGSLLDFFIQSNSKKIKTISNYGWVSGFIYWNSIIYDIPFEAEYILTS